MKVLRMVMSGIAGAAALTATHQVMRKYAPDMPQMEAVGERGIETVLDLFGLTSPEGSGMRNSMIAADAVSSALYYSQVGAGRGAAWSKGLSLGLAAGLGAIKLPGLLNWQSTGEEPSIKAQLFTVGSYLASGLVAAAAAELMERFA